MDLAPQFSMPMQMPTVNQPMMSQPQIPQPQMPQPQQTMEQRLGSLEEKFSGLTNRLDKLGSLQTGVFNQENTQQPSFYGNYPQMYLPKENQYYQQQMMNRYMPPVYGYPFQGSFSSGIGGFLPFF